MRVLLLSAYHSASHQYWCEGLMAAIPDIDWTLKTQPARHFSWRVEASGLLWALANDADFECDYDLIIATSLSDLTRLRAFRPHLATVPTWVYFHENQFAHPRSASQATDHQIGWQFLSIQNALCADWVSFNTEFNRSTFLAGARKLLRRFPEKLPGNPMARIEQRSDVLPVPLTGAFSELTDQPKEPDLIVWNHRWRYGMSGVQLVWAARWEWDKGPERLLAIVKELEKRAFPYQLAVLGKGAKEPPEAFQELYRDYGAKVVHFGFAESKEAYFGWLKSADMIISTALHEFQGVSVIEAIQHGCIPILPKRLSYPEIVSERYLYESDQSLDVEASNAVDLIEKHSSTYSIAPTVSQFEWSYLKKAYETRINKTASI